MYVSGRDPTNSKSNLELEFLLKKREWFKIQLEMGPISSQTEPNR